MTAFRELPAVQPVQADGHAPSVLRRAAAARPQGGLWLLMLAAFFVATTRWLDWQGGIATTGGQDAYQYELMSRAAPGLPDSPIGSAYTARFLLHWSVGAVARVTGLPLTMTYRVACLATMVAFALTVRLCLVRLGVTGWALRLCLALAVLNPYALRYYALVPAYLSDVVFQLGVAVALLGTQSRRFRTVLVGVVVAVLARQTIVVVAPVLAGWLLLEGRGRPGTPRRLVLAAVTVTLPFALLAGVGQLTRSFTTDFSPRLPQDTVLPLILALPATAQVLGGHVLRCAAPLLLVVVLLSAHALVRLLRRAPLPREAYLYAAAAAAVVSQPLVIGPSFPGFAGNEPRLSALGLLPLVLCLGVFLRSAATPLRGRAGGTLLVLAALASLHHLYASVGPTSATQFILLQGGAAAAAGAVVLATALPESRTPGVSASQASPP